MPGHYPGFFSQLRLIGLMQAFHYNVTSQGVCYGLSIVAQNASLIPGGLNAFQSRLCLINKYQTRFNDHKKTRDYLIQKKAQALHFLKVEEHLSESQTSSLLRNLDIINELFAFFDSVSLLQDPQKHRSLFPGRAYLAQISTNAKQLVQPLALDNKNLSTPLKLTGAYSKGDLVLLLGVLKLSFTMDVVSLLILSSNHAMHLSYSRKTNQWFCFDPNKLPGFYCSSLTQAAHFIYQQLGEQKYTLISLELNGLVDSNSLDKMKQRFERLYDSLRTRSLARFAYKDNQGATQNLLAASWGEISYFQTLKQSPIFEHVNIKTLNAPADIGITPLELASINGFTEIVQELLAIFLLKGVKYGKLNPKNESGFTPLHRACRSGHLDVVHLILEHLKRQHVSPKLLNPPNQFQSTPLHIAAELGFLGIAKRLIVMLSKENVFVHELNPPTIHGNTPLHKACQNGHYDVAQLLLFALVKRKVFHTDINPQNKLGVTPLHLACRKGHRSITRLLLFTMISQHVPVMALNPKDHHDMTPLHLAASIGDEQSVHAIMHALSMKYARTRLLNPINEQGDTPLHLACRKGHFNVVRVLVFFLLKSGLSLDELNTLNKKQNTLIHEACRSGNLSLVRFLIEGVGISANTNVITLKNSAGKTPLDLAKQEKHQSILFYLNTKLLEYLEHKLSSCSIPKPDSSTNTSIESVLKTDDIDIEVNDYKTINAQTIHHSFFAAHLRRMPEGVSSGWGEKNSAFKAIVR